MLPEVTCEGVLKIAFGEAVPKVKLEEELMVACLVVLVATFVVDLEVECLVVPI